MEPCQRTGTISAETELCIWGRLVSSGDGVRGPGMYEVCWLVGNLLETRPVSPSRVRVRPLWPLQDDTERVRDGEAS